MHAAIVTGVSRGLGEALATELLAHGLDGRGHRPHGERPAPEASDSGTSRATSRDPALVAAAVLPALRDLARRSRRAVTLINNAAVATPVGLVGRLDAAQVEAALGDQLAAPLVHGRSLLPRLSRRVSAAPDHQHFLGRRADARSPAAPPTACRRRRSRC